MKTDKEMIDELREALDILHITCETGPDKIRQWYAFDELANDARDGAVLALIGSRRFRDTTPPPTIAESDKKALLAEIIDLAKRYAAMTPETTKP